MVEGIEGRRVFVSNGPLLRVRQTRVPGHIFKAQADRCSFRMDTALDCRDPFRRLRSSRTVAW